jgi:2,3-bisphosphoglycerate-independent phosphoglycerate mutase
MKYVVLIIDGAAGRPLPKYGNQTTLELAKTPNLDKLARSGTLGLTCNVPEGMEPSSAIACMSIMGYDPRLYYKGRSAIEALSMGIKINPGETVFRCNTVTMQDGKMKDYSAGHITTPESSALIKTLDQKLGDNGSQFFAGVSYRHILKIKGHPEAVGAECTPPHDIPGQAVAGFLPKGPGSALLNDFMRRSEAILQEHPVNQSRIARGELPATTIWLFWPSGEVAELPPFQKKYGVKGCMISGVDLLRGIAQMAGLEVIKVPGVTDGLDNDYVAQANGTLQALDNHDLVVVHVEAPDEAGHSGLADEKIAAIERTDKEIVSRLLSYSGDQLSLMVLPDHPTPVDIQTHTPDQVPFLLWGPGIKPNGARRLTENEAGSTQYQVKIGHQIMQILTAKK